MFYSVFSFSNESIEWSVFKDPLAFIALGFTLYVIYKRKPEDPKSRGDENKEFTDVDPVPKASIR